MIYKLKYHKNFTKFLDKHSDIRAKVLESFELIAQNPYENNFDISKLQGEANKYRLRLGKYRFLYEIIRHKSSSTPTKRTLAEMCIND